MFALPLRRSIRLSTKTSTLQQLSKSSPILQITSINTLNFTPRRTMSNIKPNVGPPPHRMAYFPQMATTLPSTSPSFRKVLWTGLYTQVVLMTVPVGGDIGDEVHVVDQALTFTSGTGKAIINGEEQDVRAGDLVVVPAGTQHQFLNTGKEPLCLYTIYSPAEHKETSVHKTKEEGEREEDLGVDVAAEWTRRTMKENEEAGLVRESGKY